VDVVDSSTSIPSHLPLGKKLGVYRIREGAAPEQVGTFLERRKVFGLYRDSKLVTSSTKCSQYTE